MSLWAWTALQPKGPIGPDEIGFYVKDVIVAWCRMDELPDPLPERWYEPFPGDLIETNESRVAIFRLDERGWISPKEIVYEPAYRFEGWE